MTMMIDMAMIQDKTAEDQEQFIKLAKLHYEISGPVGIYKRKDGTYYAMILRGTPKDTFEKVTDEHLKNLLQRRESLIELLITQYVGTNKTVPYYDDKEIVKKRLLGEDFTPSENPSDGHFYNFRVKEIDGIPYIYAEFKKTNKDLIIPQDYSLEFELAPVLYHIENSITRIDSFYRDDKKLTINHLE